MKKIILIIFTIMSFTLYSQPLPKNSHGHGHGHGHHHDPGAPLDGGLLIILVLCAVYGGSKLYVKNKKEII